MAISNSISSISKRLCQKLLSNQKPFYYQTTTTITKSLFSTTTTTTATPSSTPDNNSYSLPDELLLPKIETDSIHDESTLSSSSSSDASSTSFDTNQHRPFTPTLLEDGLDVGIYKAILVGQVGQTPLQKRLKNGKLVTLTTVGTGGIRNERIPFANEEPREYADRCNVQWHRVAIYPENLGDVVVKHAQPGSILYLEGNLETKVFTDQVTGIVKRVREISVRRNGRVVFLGNGGDFSQPSTNELRGVGYY